MAAAISEENFADFYERNYQAVYKICYLFMKNTADAEDCTEDTFVKVLKGGVTFKDTDHERAWLTVTAGNLCKDRLKHWWHQKTESIEDYTDILHTQEPENHAVLEAVMKLPAKYKDIIYLYYYEGYPTEEIAAIKKKPPSTIRNQLSDARKKLKKLLGGDFA